MNRSELEKLFGSEVEIEQLASMTEEDVAEYLAVTGYEGNPAEIVESIASLFSPAFTEWHVLKRDGEASLVNVTVGNDPLYGRGSWDYQSGPFESYEAAVASLLGSIKTTRKAASSRENGRKGGRPRMTVEQRARARVERSPKLSAHSDTIFSDWPNWDEHLAWVASARVSEIISWAEEVEKE